MTVNVFIAGDLHIPSRATQLHPKLRPILEGQQWNYICLTGDLTSKDILPYFQSFVKDSENVIVCRGNMDHEIDLPVTETFRINDIPIGLYHGTAVSPRGDISQLKVIADKLQVRVLLTGHSHQAFIHTDHDHIILNPGTATGASGGSSWTVDTGCIVLKIDTETKELDITLNIIERGKLRKQKERVRL
jgi:putative phosphoesterase